MRRSYDQATKDAVVKDVLLYGISQPQVSEKYGIPISNINRWVTKAIKQRQDIEDYADKIEREITAEKQDAAPEGNNFDWQRLEKASAERNKKAVDNLGLRQKRDVEDAIPYAEDETGTVIEYMAEDAGCGSGAGNPSPTRMLDTDKIKAAAFDVITNQMNEYPCSSTDTMMRFIQGVQALANQLCEVE